MGMTIEESKRNLSYAIQWKDRPTDESMRLAVDIMRKYQKIEQIIEVWHQDIYAKDFECIAEVAEVIEDGNDD